MAKPALEACKIHPIEWLALTPNRPDLFLVHAEISVGHAFVRADAAERGERLLAFLIDAEAGPVIGRDRVERMIALAEARGIRPAHARDRHFVFARGLAQRLQHFAVRHAGNFEQIFDRP